MSDDDGAAQAPTTKRPRRLRLLVAGVGVAVLLGAAVGGAFALGLVGGHGSGDAVANADAHGAAVITPTFVDLPQLLVNLAVGDGRPRFLKLSVAVEVADAEAAARIDQLSPRIVDSFQLYLRTLTPAELQTPGAMFRLKGDLHRRIQEAIDPLVVADVLFKEMLVQ